MKKMLVIMVCIWMGLIQANAKATVAKITLKGEINDWNSIPRMFSSKIQPGLIDYLQEMERIKQDKKVAGLLVILDFPSASFSTFEELGQMVEELKQAGKKTFIYANYYSAKTYGFAGHFDKILTHQFGSIIPGILVEMTYMKDMLGKLGMDAQVVAIGEYKSAGDSLSRNQMTAFEKEQHEALLNSFENQIYSTLKKNRNMSDQAIKKFMDAGMIAGTLAKKEGWVDELTMSSTMNDTIKSFLKQDISITEAYDPGKRKEKVGLAAIFSALFSSAADNYQYLTSPTVAVISLSGMIVGGDKNSPYLTAEKFFHIINKIEDAPAIKAVVLRVDSPGGSVLESDEIYQKINQLKKKKLVIVSMGNVAASGGYYISCNADRIIADQTTITGSIGVVSLKLSLKETARKIGLSIETIKRGTNADLFSLFKPWTEAQKTIVRDLMQSIYQDFIGLVSKHRNLSREQVDKIGRGRVWSGQDALKIGLVDKIGGLNTALVTAKEMLIERDVISASTDLKLIYLPKKLTSMEYFMMQLEESSSQLSLNLISESQWFKKFADYFSAIKELFAHQSTAFLFPYLIEIN